MSVILELHKEEVATWDEVDYKYISYFSSEEYAASLRKAIAEQRAQERAAFLDALTVKQRALLLGLHESEPGTEDLEMHLSLSKANLYSYFFFCT